MREFRLLGPLEVVEDGRPVSIEGDKPHVLLALLLLEAGQVLSSGRLIDAVWPEGPPGSAGRVLHVYVGQLRKALGAAQIETVGAGYVLRLRGTRLDLLEFERLAEEGRALLDNDRPREATEQLAAALRLWRGDPLADLPANYLVGERARLGELRLGAIELRNAAMLAAGRHAEVVPDLAALAQRHPLRESLQAQLMLALYRCGRQAEALTVYRQVQSILHRELGLEPTAELRRLEQAILRQEPRLIADGAPVPARTLVIAGRRSELAPLLALGRLAAARSRSDVILIRLLESSADVGAATRDLEPLRSDAVRVTALRSTSATHDLRRVVADQEASLLLLEVSDEDLRGPPQMTDSPCDVAFVYWQARFDSALPIAVPFGGSDNDWAAVELAALIAGAANSALRLLAAASPGDGDVDRFLASAALIIQRFLPAAVEPVVMERGDAGTSAALAGCGLVITGLGDWAAEGIGDARLRLTRRAVPAIFVRRGLRPGLIAPAHTLTRFRWTVT